MCFHYRVPQTLGHILHGKNIVGKCRTAHCGWAASCKGSLPVNTGIVVMGITPAITYTIVSNTVQLGISPIQLTHFFFQTTSICTVHYTFCTASTFMSCSEVMPTRCQKKQPEHLDYPLLKGQKNLRSWWERQNQSWRDKIKRSHPGQCTHVGFLSTTKNQDYLWANQLHDCYI